MARVAVVVLLKQVLPDIHLRRRFKYLAALDHHLAALRRAEPEGAIEDDVLDVVAAVLTLHVQTPCQRASSTGGWGQRTRALMRWPQAAAWE